MDPTWYTIEASTVVGVFATTLLVYVALILIVRVNGLRSFSKMSSHDFAITVAIGSVIASTVVAETPSLGNGVAALVALIAVQRVFSSVRRRLDPSPVDNQPLLLMRDGEILEDNLARARVTHDDLLAKLREANVMQLSAVRAAVMESTGDVSVLHGEGASVDPRLLEDVSFGS